MKSLQHRMVPPTINLEKADPLCDLDYVAEGGARSPGWTPSLSNSFAIGGVNAALLFRRPGSSAEPSARRQAPPSSRARDAASAARSPRGWRGRARRSRCTITGAPRAPGRSPPRWRRAGERRSRSPRICRIRRRARASSATPKGSLGRLDILVLNAGVAKGGPVMAGDGGGIRETIEVNLLAALYLTAAAVPGMLRRRFGRVVALASPTAEHGGHCRASARTPPRRPASSGSSRRWPTSSPRARTSPPTSSRPV